VNYDNSRVVTITMTCNSWAPSSGDHLFTCGAIYLPPHWETCERMVLLLIFNAQQKHCNESSNILFQETVIGVFLYVTADVLAGIAARQWLLIVVRHVLLYCVWTKARVKKIHCCANVAQFSWLLP